MPLGQVVDVLLDVAKALLVRLVVRSQGLVDLLVDLPQDLHQPLRKCLHLVLVAVRTLLQSRRVFVNQPAVVQNVHALLERDRSRYHVHLVQETPPRPDVLLLLARSKHAELLSRHPPSL